MLGLGAYESSSEDEAPVTAPQPKAKETPKERPAQQPSVSQAPTAASVPEPVVEPPPTVAEPTGPVVGPFQPQRTPSPPLDRPRSRQSSPFSTTRTLVQDLTLPPVPNLDIPPSPPGSPDPVANKKFAHFLDLKKQGTHFNEKLASSSSLKNPSLLTKLRQHVGIDEKGQYATSLPLDIWDPSALPAWGYKEELLKSQQELRRVLEEKKAAGQRESIEFVSGGTPSGSSRGGTPSSGRGKSSLAERVMSGLSRDHNDPTARRPPRAGESGSKRSHSRSPANRRKRSRSR
ncbi:Proteasome subunit beta type-7 [Paecilomyces lecythidis]